MFKLDIRAETSVGPVSIIVSGFSANWKVPTYFSKIIMFQC